MKFARFIKNSAEEHQKSSWGIIEKDHVVVLKGSPFTSWEKTDEQIKIFDVQILIPCKPTKIVCVGLNYQDHADELKMKVPDEPVLFLKPSSSILGPEGSIIKPKGCGTMDYEAELAVVMGKEGKNIPIEEVPDHVLGYTCFNDITARDLQKKDGQWTRAKSFDTFAPIGPYISANIDPNRLKIELILNEKVRQSSCTSQMVFSTEKLVSFVSKVMTLYPGDLITTGTPPGVGKMKPGDIVEVVIEKIGSLRNYITEEE
ncbi:fumarylacetoacetate hydrolase family protein [Elusimicrobiota bacterium]